MPDYEQFITDAHTLARDSSYLNNRAKERLLDASNAIRYALSKDCELQNQMYSQSPETYSIPLLDGFHHRASGYMFPPSHLTLSSDLPQSQVWQQPASPSIPYVCERLSEDPNAYTTYIPPRSHQRIRHPSAVSVQLDTGADSYIHHGMGDPDPLRVAPHHHSSAKSQASTVQFNPFASSSASFPTSLDGLLEDTSLRQISQTSNSMIAGRTCYHPTHVPDFLERTNKTTLLGQRGDSYHVGPTDALLGGPDLITDPENSIFDTTNLLLSHEPSEPALASMNSTETLAHWLHSSPPGLVQYSDSVAEFDASVSQMPPTQDSLTNVGQTEPQLTFSGPGALELTGITHSSPDNQRGAQITPQEKSLAAPASPSIDRSIDDLSGQYLDVGGDSAVLAEDFYQTVEGGSQTLQHGENSPETGMDLHCSDPSIPTTPIGASLSLTREDLMIVGRAHKVLASSSKPMKAVSKSRTLTKAGRALTVDPQSKNAEVGRRRACVLCKKDKKQVSNVSSY